MKKLISIIVVFFLVFTLTGCDKLKTISVKNETTEVYNSKTVQDILNTIKITSK